MIQAQHMAVVARKNASPPSGLVDFSDDFSGDGNVNARALSGGIGTWAVAAGALNTSGGVLRSGNGSFAKNLAVIGTDCGSVTQYALYTITMQTGSVFPHIVLRYTDSSSAYYSFEIEAQAGVWGWYKYPSAAGSGTQIGSSIDLDTVTGTEWGITLTGTGAGTEVRLWKNPVATKPISATEWDSGDTTPDGSWIGVDPAGNAVDTGQKMGFQCFQSSADTGFADNYFAGGL